MHGKQEHRLEVVFEMWIMTIVQCGLTGLLRTPLLKGISGGVWG